MPRPTAAQLAYGSATVVLSTVALLLLTRATDGVAVAAIGIASLALGLLVALTPSLRHRAAPRRAAAPPAAPASDPLTAGTSAARAHVGAEARAGQHSLRR
ncbi:hypothetical protein ACH4D4_32505 [Streptomyces pristinaespiralis]|uniref:hypothetical protein n=1 Tax=Streptomyces pristinaespiralis TaxID=38300 RepID=UPI0037B2A243